MTNILTHETDHYLLKFKQDISDYTLPERFTFPFYYQPHALCLLAAQELQTYLQQQTDWCHNFGLAETESAATPIGKMFGVLLVQKSDGEIGYLAAFSGKLADSNHLPYFVPPIFDMLEDESFFKQEQLKINCLNERILALEADSVLLALIDKIDTEKAQALQAINKQQALMVAQRKIRKKQRQDAKIHLTANEYQQLEQSLSQKSIAEKLALRDIKQFWQARIQVSTDQQLKYLDELALLKQQRKALSNALQQRLFTQYRFLNQAGGIKDLADIFSQTSQGIPSAGAGECAAPKLLQYAFKAKMQPLGLAEFWWGAAPKSEVRQHGNFYPACQGKCQPILTHMLEGMRLDDNPLLKNLADDKALEIIYEDAVILVVNKPADLLSVPGKAIQDSVYQRIKQAYPNATGPLIVHRLDMSTSGLMVVALSKQAHKFLQQQFMSRCITKRYIALLEGELSDEQGVITLPLRVDLEDRPKQLVCYQYGKAAETKWQRIACSDKRTRVYFYPVTGRTHQLRVHSAHSLGLNSPIAGDDLYGHKAERLCLHAESLGFKHPESKKWLDFQLDADF